MIRYFGFLANRVRKKLLPKVYKALNFSPKVPKQIRFESLYEQSWKINPFTCILCQSRMQMVQVTYGKSLSELYQYYEKAHQRQRFL